MMDKELVLKIRSLVQGAREVAALGDDIERLSKQGRQQIPDPTENIRKGAEQTRGIISGLGRDLLGLVSAGAIGRFVQETVREFAAAESAFRGLESVANASGFGVANALKEAQRLAADGLISVAEASKGLQNLLSRGYSLDQAVATLERLKDSAAFNRAAHLSMGEAVVTATEGLKNENSILVDNAGVTKNVAKIWDDYASQLGVTTNSLTQQQKIEAEYQGIMAETQAQLGNSQKALQGYQGQMAQADQSTLKFKQSLGELLAPAMIGLAQIGTSLIDTVFKPIVLAVQALAVGSGVLANVVGRIFTAIRTGDFSGISDAIKRDFETGREVLADYAKNLQSGTLEITKNLKGGADAQKIIDNALKRAAANGDEQKKLTQDRIKDYEKLRDAIRQAWQDSIQAEKDYLAEARQLRAEANSFNVKSLAGASPQEVATQEISMRGDLNIAQQRLQRMVSEGAPLNDIREQAKAVQELAEQYRTLADVTEEDRDKADISQRSDEAIKQSKLDLAKALEQAAADEKQRQEDQRQLLADIERSLAELEKPRVMNVETEQAKTAVTEVKAKIDEIPPVTTKTLIVNVQKTGPAIDPALQLGSSDQFGINSPFPSFADGGVIPGNSPHDRADNILLWGTAGEGVVNIPAMRYYGGKAFLDAINSLQFPKFADGGVIGRSAAGRISMPSFSAPTRSTGRDRGRLVLPNGESVEIEASPRSFDTLERSIRIQTMKRGSRA